MWSRRNYMPYCDIYKLLLFKKGYQIEGVTILVKQFHRAYFIE